MAKQNQAVPPDHPPAVFKSNAGTPPSHAGFVLARLGPSNFQVRYDPALGADGQSLAQQVLQTAEGDLAKIVRIFGAPPAQGPFVIDVTQTGPDGQPLGGAVHMSNGGLEIWCNPVNPDTNQLDVDWTRMLVVAEVVEDFEFWQGIGWDMLHTNGEGLSRLLASALYPNVGLPSRAALANGYIQAGMPDCISDNSGADTDPVSNGGAVLFLNWLTTGIGYGYDQVVQHGGATLAETYTNLQARNDAYDRFVANLRALSPGDLTTDNPFVGHPAQMNVRKAAMAMPTKTTGAFTFGS